MGLDGLDSFNSGRGQVAGSFDNDSDSSGFHKMRRICWPAE